MARKGCWLKDTKADSRATFMLSKEENEELDKIAKEKGMTLSSYTRELIIRDLNKKGDI